MAHEIKQLSLFPCEMPKVFGATKAFKPVPATGKPDPALLRLS